MKTNPFSIAASILALALVASAQSTDPNPVGPLSTNNAQSACVQYGDCTKLPASNTYMTASQKGPVTPPASSIRTAAPTDSAGSAASISALASSGADAAYSSLLAQGKVGSGPGDTSISLTASVQAVSSSASSGGSGGSGGSNAAVQGVQVQQWVPVAAALAAVALGAGAVML